MNSKAIRRQLLAAVAMVLVAAVALGSSTYAWFVSNNTVTGTTTNIAAQSNSAYMVIDIQATSASSTSSVSAGGNTQSLYPATIVAGEGKPVFQSAYAEVKTAAGEKAGTRFTIGAAGTPAEAVAADYAFANKFYIGTGGYDGQFSDLDITGITATNTDSGLASAMRVLVVCGDNWQVWSPDGEVAIDGAAGTLKDSFGKGADAEVDVYVYYEGSAQPVYTTNLGNLTACGVTITFTATPTEYKGTTT